MGVNWEKEAGPGEKGHEDFLEKPENSYETQKQAHKKSAETVTGFGGFFCGCEFLKNVARILVSLDMS